MFAIQEGAGLYCDEVKLPPFTRGKRQLSKIEVDATRRLSRVCIHVERIIGLIQQKYRHTLFELHLHACNHMCMPLKNTCVHQDNKLILLVIHLY